MAKHWCYLQCQIHNEFNCASNAHTPENSQGKGFELSMEWKRLNKWHGQCIVLCNNENFFSLIHIRYFMKPAIPLYYRSDRAWGVIGVVVDYGFWEFRTGFSLSHVVPGGLSLILCQMSDSVGTNTHSCCQMLELWGGGGITLRVKLLACYTLRRKFGVVY